MPVSGLKANQNNSTNEAAQAGKESGVKRSALKNEFVKGEPSSYPFLNSKNEAAANNGLQDIMKGLPLPAQQHLKGNVKQSNPLQAHVFQKGELQPCLENTAHAQKHPLVPSKSETTNKARWRSLLDRVTSKKDGTKLGIASNSPLARMNRASVPRSMNETFFRERARAQGFTSNNEPHDDKALSEFVKQEKEQILKPIGKYSKTERGYLALEIARLQASNRSLKDHKENSANQDLDHVVDAGKNASAPPMENDGIDRGVQPPEDIHVAVEKDAEKELDDHPDAADSVYEAADSLYEKVGSGLMKRETAERMASSIENRDQMMRLTEAAIEEGVTELEYYLDPENDLEKHFPEQSERDEIVSEFRKTCADYNSAVDARIALRKKQQEALDDTPLAHLAMPVELRGSKTAHEIYSEAAKAARHTWTPNSILGWAKEYAKKLLAIPLAIPAAIFALFGWTSAREFVLNRFPQYRESKICIEAAKRQAEQLKRHHQTLAENWVKEQYKIDPTDPELRKVKNQELYDPHGLFAAFANYTRSEIVTAVQKQLTLAAEAELLEYREKRAQILGVNINDKAANVDNEEGYFTDEAYLSALAEGIVDGMENALGDAFMEQLKFRQDKDVTTAANAFVSRVDTQVELSCGKAWNAVEKMMDANLYSQTRKLNCDEAIEAQEQRLRSIANEVNLIKDGSAPDKHAPNHTSNPDLPADGKRMEHLEYAMSFAQNEIESAKLAAKVMDDMLGDLSHKGSLLSLDADLMQDAKGGRVEAAYDPEKCKADYDDRTKAIANLKADLEKNADVLTDDVYQGFEEMLANLEARAAAQRDIRLAIFKLNEKMQAANSAEDLAGLAEKFETYVNDRLFRMEMALGLGKRFNIPEFVAASKDLMRQTLARLDGVQQLLEAHHAAGNTADAVIIQINNLEISLDKGLQRIDQAYQPFFEHHKNCRSQHKGLADMLPDPDGELQEKHAQLLIAAMQLNKSENQERQNLLAGALPKIDFLYKAGVLNDDFAAAFQGRLEDITKEADGAPSIDDFADAVAKLGVDEAGKEYAEEFANFLYPSEPEKRLKLQIDLLRHAGADVNEINAVKRAHYRNIAKELYSTLNNQVFDKLLKEADAPDKWWNHRFESFPLLYQANASIFSENNLDAMTAATNNLRTLLNQPDQDLSDVQISQAMALIEQLAKIGNDEKSDVEQLIEIVKDEEFDANKAKADRISFERERISTLQNDIAEELGLDGPAAFRDTTFVKEAANSSINNLSQFGNVDNRSTSVHSLIKAQQHSAELLESAVIQPLRAFAERLPSDVATAAQTRTHMESEASIENAYVLENLNRLLAADRAVQENAVNDETDNAIYGAGLEALTRLSHELHDFKPSTLEGDNAFSDRLVTWRNNHQPEDVVRQLKENGLEGVADKFTDIWNHLVVHNALGQSKDALNNELDALVKARDDLMTAVQRHRSNQLAMAAVLMEVEKTKGSVRDFKLTGKRIKNIEATLRKWGAAGAWKTLCEDYKLKQNDAFSMSLLKQWSNDCADLPSQVQRQLDKLNKALISLEKLSTLLTESNTAMADTYLENGAIPSLEEQKRISNELQAHLHSIDHTPANYVFKNLLVTLKDEDWTTHPDWRSKLSLKVLSGQTLEEFNTSFAGAIKETYPDDAQADAVIKLMNAAADLDRELRAVKGMQLYDIKPSKQAFAKLDAKIDALDNARRVVQQHIGAGHDREAASPENKNLLSLIAEHMVTDVNAYVHSEMKQLNKH